MTAERPTVDELEARVREGLNVGPLPVGWTELDKLDTAADALTELTARAEAAEALDAWASSMPDAGFTDSDPRWDWWHRRPRSTP